MGLAHLFGLRGEVLARNGPLEGCLGWWNSGDLDVLKPVIVVRDLVLDGLGSSLWLLYECSIKWPPN